MGIPLYKQQQQYHQQPVIEICAYSPDLSASPTFHISDSPALAATAVMSDPRSSEADQQRRFHQPANLNLALLPPSDSSSSLSTNAPTSTSLTFSTASGPLSPAHPSPAQWLDSSVPYALEDTTLSSSTFDPVVIKRDSDSSSVYSDIGSYKFPATGPGPMAMGPPIHRPNSPSLLHHQSGFPASPDSGSALAGGAKFHNAGMGLSSLSTTAAFGRRPFPLAEGSSSSQPYPYPNQQHNYSPSLSSSVGSFPSAPSSARFDNDASSPARLQPPVTITSPVPTVSLSRSDSAGIRQPGYSAPSRYLGSTSSGLVADPDVFEPLTPSGSQGSTFSPRLDPDGFPPPRPYQSYPTSRPVNVNKMATSPYLPGSPFTEDSHVRSPTSNEVMSSKPTHLEPYSPVVHSPGSGSSQSRQSHQPGMMHHYQQTTHHTTTHHSATFLPSSAYLPSRPAFPGVSTTTPNAAPRSAPSTPLGRQDARFLSNSRFWSSPQPPHADSFGGSSAGSPMVAQSPAMSGTPSHLNASTTFSPMMVSPAQPSASSFDYAEQEYSGGPYRGNYGASYSPAPSSQEDYSSSSTIPYARGPKAPHNRRIAATAALLGHPCPDDPVTPRKGVKKVGGVSVKQETSPASTMASPSTPAKHFVHDSSPEQSQSHSQSQSRSLLSQSQSQSMSRSSSDETKKAQRCKIACSACRKTRLKCDGGHPCTSCIDKHLKLHSNATEAEATAFIEQEQSCQYENFVRRRGKGKKTLMKEREEAMARDALQRQQEHHRLYGNAGLGTSLGPGHGHGQRSLFAQPSHYATSYHHHPHQHQHQHQQQQHLPPLQSSDPYGYPIYPSSASEPLPPSSAHAHPHAHPHAHSHPHPHAQAMHAHASSSSSVSHPPSQPHRSLSHSQSHPSLLYHHHHHPHQGQQQLYPSSSSSSPSLSSLSLSHPPSQASASASAPPHHVHGYTLPHPGSGFDTV